MKTERDVPQQDDVQSNQKFFAGRTGQIRAAGLAHAGFGIGNTLALLGGATLAAAASPFTPLLLAAGAMCIAVMVGIDANDKITEGMNIERASKTPHSVKDSLRTAGVQVLKGFGVVGSLLFAPVAASSLGHSTVLAATETTKAYLSVAGVGAAGIGVIVALATPGTVEQDVEASLRFTEWRTRRELAEAASLKVNPTAATPTLVSKV